MKRKLFLGLGTVASVAAPIVAVVSCGDEVISGKMSWNRSDKEVVFNLSGDAPDGAFAAYGVDFDGLKALDEDFATIVAQNNVLNLPEGADVKATFFLGFKETKLAINDEKATVNSEADHKVKVTVEFKYSTKHSMGKGTGLEAAATTLTAPEYKDFKTNIVEVLAKALTTSGKFITGKSLATIKTSIAKESTTVKTGTSDVETKDAGVQHLDMLSYEMLTVGTKTLGLTPLKDATTGVVIADKTALKAAKDANKVITDAAAKTFGTIKSIVKIA